MLSLKRLGRFVASLAAGKCPDVVVLNLFPRPLIPGTETQPNPVFKGLWNLNQPRTKPGRRRPQTFLDWDYQGEHHVWFHEDGGVPHSVVVNGVSHYDGPQPKYRNAMGIEKLVTGRAFDYGHNRGPDGPAHLIAGRVSDVSFETQAKSYLLDDSWTGETAIGIVFQGSRHYGSADVVLVIAPAGRTFDEVHVRSGNAVLHVRKLRKQGKVEFGITFMKVPDAPMPPPIEWDSVPALREHQRLVEVPAKLG